MRSIAILGVLLLAACMEVLSAPGAAWFKSVERERGTVTVSWVDGGEHPVVEVSLDARWLVNLLGGGASAEGGDAI